MVGLPAAALALVPWGTLIEKAPAIAAGASDLYLRVRGRKVAAPAIAAADPIVALEARLADLEAEVERSAHLIAGLAEANAGLLVAVERGTRTTRIALGIALLALATAAAGVLA